MIDILRDNIRKLKQSRYSFIEEYEQSKIPAVYDLQLERSHDFLMHGQYHKQYRENHVLYVVNNLPYINRRTHVISNTIQELVDNQELFPILIFANGKFIKWSDIRIISDCKYTYMLIQNLDNKIDYDIQCIKIPFNIDYYENNNSKLPSEVFRFNSKGSLVKDVSYNDTVICVDTTLTRNLYIEHSDLDIHNNLECNIDHRYEITRSNILVFNNGLFDAHAEVVFKGLNTFVIDGGNININSSYFVFYRLDNNYSKNNIYSLPNHIQGREYLLLNATKSIMQELNEQFNFDVNKDITYDENLLNAFDYIMKYNGSLLNTVYKELNTIKSYEYTGKYFKSKAINGHIRMSRKIGNSVCGCMIFKNGLLYEYYHMIKYDNKDFIIPCIDIKDTDRIEVLLFKNVDNNIYPIYMSSLGDDIYNLSSSINLKDIKLFSPILKSREYNVENSQYEINYVLNKNNDGSVFFHPADPFYYDKTLYIASSRQFRYQYRKIAKDCIDIELSKDFMYCNDKDKYMVFINGRKLEKFNYIINIPDSTNCYPVSNIYVNIPLHEGDLLEIFYVPDSMDEIEHQPSIGDTNMVIVDRSKLDYSFCADTYLVFMNGKKVAYSDINEINTNAVSIKSIESTSNFTLIKYIKPVEQMSDYIKHHTSTYEGIINRMANNMIKLLFNIYDVNNVDENMQSNVIDNKYLVYNIISKYYLNASIYTGGEFMFEFESYFDKDENGNYIIPALNANLEDKYK